MELSDILHLLRKGKWFIISFALLGLIGSAVLSVLATKTYQASTSVYVSVRSEGASSAYDVGQGSGAAAQKVKGYLSVVRSTSILAPVVQSLGLKVTPDVLAGRITATSPGDSVLVQISAVDTSPERAAAIANATAKSLITVTTTQLDPAGVHSQSPVVLSVVEPAVAPSRPTSPNLRLNLGLGLVSGLGLGLGAAFVRSALDNRIRSARDIETVTDAPVLGTLGFLPDATTAPLIVHDAPQSPRAESFRALRTNLQFVGPHASTRSFLVTSAMPSEGKTTATANLAIALAESGTRVLLVDADLRRPRVAHVMGLEGAVGLSDILVGRAEIDDVVQPWGHDGLDVLPAGGAPPNPSELLGSQAMHALLDSVSSSYDVILVDAPPLLPVTDAAVVSKLVSGVLVVAAANRTRGQQLSLALDGLDRIGSKVLGIIVTMLPTKGVDAYGYGGYGTYYGRDRKAKAHESGQTATPGPAPAEAPAGASAPALASRASRRREPAVAAPSVAAEVPAESASDAVVEFADDLAAEFDAAASR